MNPSSKHPRKIAIGDIHGCLEEFQELLEKLQLRPGVDRVLCLGDFMDKGHQPAECVKHARKMGLDSIQGNHEEKHVRWRRHEAKRRANPKYKNPMAPLSDKDAEQNALLSDEDISWLAGLPVFVRFAPGWVAVHGGVLPGKPVEDQKADTVIRARFTRLEGGEYKTVPTDYGKPGRPENSVHWTEVYDGHDHVVVGHEAHSLSQPLVVQGSGRGVCYGIDTGCVHGGRLTALVLTEGELAPSFVQVAARKVWAPSHLPIPA